MRGINVGGKNKLPMKELIALFEAAGAAEASTYIQSGNVIFDGSAQLAKDMTTTIPAAIEDRFGYVVPVVVRSSAALRKVAAQHPLAGAKPDPKTLSVAFLAKKPSAKRVASLDADRSPPDRFLVRGSDIFLCCPKGMARTKLTNAYFDKQLDTVSTVRNWNTVQKLVALCG